jgi:hypothetical protein
MAIGTAAAIIGGAVIGGIASKKANDKAVDAQVEGQNQSIAEQRRQFDATQANLQPFQDAGQAAIGEQQNLIGLNGNEAQQASFDAFNASPGQKFLRDRAQKNLLRNSAAIGGLGGGNVRSALVEQGVGFAQQDYNNQFGRLGQLAGQGQTAATNIGNFGANASNNISNSYGNIGNARASGIQNQNQIFQNVLGQVSGGFGTFGGTQPKSFTNGVSTNQFQNQFSGQNLFGGM